MSYALIAARQKTHGEFADTARVAQRLKEVLRDEAADLTDEQREAIDGIFVKLARIVAGDADHADHWRDIAGYALLAIAYDAEADSVGSYEAAVTEIGRRVKSGAEPVPTTGYFAAPEPEPTAEDRATVPA